MSDKYVDPSGDTEAFRAFVNDPQAKPDGGRPKSVVFVAAVAVAVLLVGVLVWLLTG